MSLFLQVGGAFLQYRAQQRMVKEQTAASQRAENARQQQMQLDASHRRRQAVREALIARSSNLTAGVAQGAQEGSGVQGAMGQAVNMGWENQQMTSASEVLGNRVFAANRAYSDATLRGQRGMAFGSGLSTLGGALAQMSGTMTQIGAGFGGFGGFGSMNQFQNTPAVGPIPSWRPANSYYHR